jgi:hypothetical protein
MQVANSDETQRSRNATSHHFFRNAYMLSSRLITAPNLGGVVIASALLIGGCASTTNTPSMTSDLIRTVYSDDGVSELSTPDAWTMRPDFGPDAAIRIAKDTGEAYLLVNSYFPGDIEPVALSEFAETWALNLATNLPNAEVIGPKTLSIDGMEAYRYVVSGDLGSERLTYVTTVAGGARAMHHLIGWVAADNYSGEQHVLNRMTGSFRESAYARPARQRVSLNFAWPHQLQSVAAFHRKSIKRGKASEVKAHYLSTVRPGDHDELIVSTRVVNQDVINGDSRKGDYLSKLLKQITTEIPDYVISNEGEFVRVDNLSAYQRRIETAVVSDLPVDVKGREAEILAIVRPSLSEQFLAATVTDEWNKTVGSWVSSSYAMGETYHFKEEYYAPSLADVPFAMDVSRQISGYAPCTGSESNCVKLIYIATVSGEDIRAAMANFLERTVGKPVNVKQVSVVRKREIIAEPDTLIPHRSLSTEETIVVIEDSSGKAHTSRDTQDTRVTYSYETRTASR